MKRTELKRTSQLRRGKPLRAVTPLKSAAPARTVTGTPQRKPARDTGFSAAVKLAIRTRAGNGNPELACCESCGAWLGCYGGLIQHRWPRKMGGTRRPVISSIVNGVLQCGTPQSGCNGLAEARDPHMNGMGFWLKEGEHPARTPIMLHGAGGGGVTVWLTPEGSYSATPPEVAA